jgi:hypothetical protein
VERHAPVLNAAVHYRWSVGVALRATSLELPPPIAWTVGAAGRSLPRGATLDASLSGDATADFHLARLPADAVPEAVLARLSALRGDPAAAWEPSVQRGNIT